MRIRSISWICTPSDLPYHTLLILTRTDSVSHDATSFDAAGESGQNQDDEGELTLPQLKKMLIQFERVVKKNQEMRVKFPDEPEKCVSFDLYSNLGECAARADRFRLNLA